METLPKVTADNLNTTVMPTLIAACNSHLKKCKETGRAGDFVEATGAIFDYAETLGFSSALYYLCGTNVQQGFIDCDHWKNWPFGRQEVPDLNSHATILKLMVFRVISEIMGTPMDTDASYPDIETRNRGSLPAFTSDGRAEAVTIFGNSLASYLKFLQDEVYKKDKLAKTNAERAVWTMLRLKFLLGFIDGVAYANPDACKTLQMSWFIKSNGARIADPYTEVTGKIRKQSEAAGFVPKILNSLSLISGK